MRVLTLSVLAFAAAASMALVRVAQAQQPPQVTRYGYWPLEGDSSREVRLLTVVVPPGGSTPFHTHAGDQWEMIQEGALTFAIKGQPPKVLRIGDVIYIPRGTVHRNQNLTDKPARTVELTIADKNSPAREVVNN
jgi:quercetin dioxygenase-like cupin family protein